MPLSQHNKQALKNPWVIGLSVAFALFLLANVSFIYLAFKQSPNLISEGTYERGMHYEADKGIEKASKWQLVWLPPHKIIHQQKQQYQMLVQGENIEAVSDVKVILYAYRPSDADEDFMVQFDEKSRGQFQQDLSFPLAGKWDVIIEVTQNDKQASLARSVFVQVADE